MKNFNRDRKGNDRGGFKPHFGDSQPVKLHSAVCTTCHKNCEVPFRPNGDKPVYCRDCFAGRAALGGERSNRRDIRVDQGNSDSRPDFRNNFKREFPRDTPQKFIPENAPMNRVVEAPKNDETKRALEVMNVKLDKLVSAVFLLTQKMDERVKMETKVKHEDASKVEEKVVKAESETKKKKVAKK